MPDMPAFPPLPALSLGTDVSAAPPLTAEEFADRFDALGPTEPRPKLAVAVSGGADSLALLHLVRDLVRARGGSLHAVTVDHGLRPGSSGEATTVAGWMHDLGVPHTTLRWADAKPGGNLQAVARGARYDLLDRWCGDHGILHLMTAHHAGDQAETRVLRLARRAGATGLAGMSAVEELDRCRILRPLLTVPRARLEATLTARGHAWIDDPSNLDRRFDRVRVRAGLPAPTDQADIGDQFATARAREDDALARLLARAVAVTPFGAAQLDNTQFLTVGRDLAGRDLDGRDLDGRALAARALGAVLATIGGGTYPPRHDGLRATVDDWLPGAGQTLPRPQPLAIRTLGGCRIAPGPDGTLLVTREAGRIDHRLDLAPDADFLWDGRFRLRTSDACRGLSVAPVTDRAWREMCRALPWIDGPRIDGPWVDSFGLSRAVRTALPGVYREGRIVGLPLLDAWIDRPAGPAAGASTAPVSAVLAPRRALTRSGFVAATNLVCRTASVV